MRILPLLRLLLALGCLLASCADRNLEGGSGAEAGNGLQVAAVEASGKPVVGARIELRSASSQTLAPTYTDTTGTEGTARLDIPEGSWIVVVRKGDLAFLAKTNGAGLVRDTLRPTSDLSGFLEGGAGNRIQAFGLGTQTLCDTDGFFRLEGIPSGQIPLGIEAQGILIPSTLELDPGIHAIAIAAVDSVPGRIRGLASDSLVPWLHNPLPALLPRQALGDTGSYWVAVRIHRTSTTEPVSVFSWGADDKNRIRLGWQGPDTLVLDVNGRPQRAIGSPLDTGSQDVGLSWDGHLIEVWRGGKRIASLTDNTGSMGRRTTWGSPEFAGAGTTLMDWIAFKRGPSSKDWFERLSGM